MSKAVFYHAGCPVCIGAENDVLQLIDRSHYDLEIVHLGETPGRITEARKLGVKSVPVLVLDNGSVLHINYGAGLDDLAKS